MRLLQGNLTPRSRSVRPIDPGVRVGHVHLRTADIDRIRAFYVDVLGFDVVFEARDVPGWGTTGDILFLSAGGYHHHLGFNTWKSAGGPPQPDGVTGLHHVALNYPTRAALGDAVLRLREADWPLRQLADHGTHLAVYISDPDGNDVELAWDRPVEEWPRDDDGHVAMAIDDEFDVESLVAERELTVTPTVVPDGWRDAGQICATGSSAAEVRSRPTARSGASTPAPSPAAPR